MKAHIYLTVLFLLCIFSVSAQNSIIKGTVFDNSTNETIPYASISSKSNLQSDQIIGTTSEENGSYQIEVPPGKYNFSFSFLGYKKEIRTVEVAANEVLVLDVRIDPLTSLLETVVITGDKYERPISQVTVSLEVIKSAALENANDTEISQSIEKVPGVDVINGQANIRGGSGFSYGAGSRVLLLMDGLPMLTGDAGFPFWSFLPIENVNQVEIIKGAASALYGSSAMNGIINLRTDYAKDKAQTKISAFTGFYSKPKNNETGIYKYLDSEGQDITFNGNSSFANSLLPDLPAAVKAQIADSIEYVKAWWDDPPMESGISFSHKQKVNKLDIVLSGMWLDRTYWRAQDIVKRTRIYGGFRYRPNIKGLSFGINTNFMKNTSNNFLIWDLETDSSSIDFNPVGQYQMWDNTFRITNDAYKLTIDPFVEYYTENGWKHKFLGRYFRNNNRNDSNQSTISDTFYGEFQTQKRIADLDLSLVGGIVGQKVLVDAELFGDTIVVSNRDAGRPNDTLFTNGMFDASNYAIYLQADKKFGERFNASIGARFESNSILGERESKPVFRTGINYQLAEFSFLRASFGQAYRFPTIAEKFIQTDLGAADIGISIPIGIFPNPNLRSESGWSAEIGIKQGFKISGFRGYVDASAFINEYNDMMEFTFGVSDDLLGLIKGLGLWEDLDTVVINIPNTAAVGFQSVNIGNTRIYGTDISLAGTGKLFGLNTNILTGYTFIVPRYQDFGQVEQILSSSDQNILKYRFQHTFKLDGDMRYKNISFGQSMRYYSFMESIDEAFNKFLPGVESFRAANNSGTFVWDGRIQYHLLNDSHTISLICKNMLNNEYSLRPAIMDAPRSYTIKYTLKL